MLLDLKRLFALSSTPTGKYYSTLEGVLKYFQLEYWSIPTRVLILHSISKKVAQVVRFYMFTVLYYQKY